DNYMNFGITTLMGQEITIYPWSPPDIEIMEKLMY
ncbi:phage domain protein, partial [Clostridioides difficile P78]